jgi:hypothetical protein
MKFNPFEQLHGMRLPEKPEHDTEKKKESKKEIDILSRDILRDNPELTMVLEMTLDAFTKENIALPIIHVSSKEVRTASSAVQTGFLENIRQRGFRAKDTNVGAFVKRGEEKTKLAEPIDFVKRPEQFVKSVILFLDRYAHHGIRTNKQSLGEMREKGKGVPVMVLIDGDVSLEHGSDFDDHYRLRESVNGEKILGLIELEDRTLRTPENISTILKDFVSIMKKKLEQTNDKTHEF